MFTKICDYIFFFKIIVTNTHNFLIWKSLFTPGNGRFRLLASCPHFSSILKRSHIGLGTREADLRRLFIETDFPPVLHLLTYSVKSFHFIPINRNQLLKLKISINKQRIPNCHSIFRIHKLGRSILYPSRLTLISFNLQYSATRPLFPC